MSSTRLESLKAMVPDDPNDPLLRYMLANEYFKASQYEAAIAEINTYLELKPDDEGAIFRLLAQSHQRLGRSAEAKAAYERGIVAANQHGHPGMAEEFQLAIEDLE